MTNMGCSSEILKRNAKRLQDPVLWAWHEIFDTPRVIGGFREGAEEAAAPLFFSCIFKTFLYDPNPSNRPLSVLINIQSGFNFIQFRSPLSEFSGSDS